VNAFEKEIETRFAHDGITEREFVERAKILGIRQSRICGLSGTFFSRAKGVVISIEVELTQKSSDRGAAIAAIGNEGFRTTGIRNPIPTVRANRRSRNHTSTISQNGENAL
jgi:hypothetical protein